MNAGNIWLSRRRWIDSAVVVLAAPVVMPLGAAACAAVYVSDRHAPVLSFDRVGHRGRRLTMRKIRSMRPAAGGESKITGAADNRVTPVGALLRKFRIDELPQLLPVLSGQMAIIGPRPEDPAFVDVDDPVWQDVLEARPGIAGLAQVIAGAWEETELVGEDPTSLYLAVALPAKMAIDRHYAQFGGPAMDWMIIRSLFEQFILGAEETTAHRYVAAHIPEAHVFFGATSESATSPTGPSSRGVSLSSPPAPHHDSEPDLPDRTAA